MSEEYGNDFITLTDEEGNQIELEHLDTLEYNGETYMAFVEAVDTPEQALAEDSTELVVLKVAEENGEEILVTVDNDDELEAVFDLVVARLEDLYAADETADEDTVDFSEDEDDK
jgi:hypothetical protein